MRVGCFYFPHFPLQIELKDDPSAIGAPVIIGGYPHQKKPVLDASEEAIASGITAGIPLRQAYSLCPEGIFIQGNQDRYREAFQDVLCLLEDYASAVEDAGPGMAFIQIPLSTGEAEYMTDICRSIWEKNRLEVSAASASGKLIAQIVSQVTSPGEIIILSQGEEHHFLEELPVTMLPAPLEISRRLRLLGIRSIGQLASLPRSAVGMEFGAAGERLWDLSNGIDLSCVMPGQQNMTIEGDLCFDFPVECIEHLMHGIEKVIHRLVIQLNQRWQSCRRVVIYLIFDDGQTFMNVMEFKVPISSAAAMLRQVRYRMETLKFISPVSEIRVVLAETCADAGAQIDLILNSTRYPHKLAEAIKRLQKRYDHPVVRKLIRSRSNSRLPERAFSFADFS